MKRTANLAVALATMLVPETVQSQAPTSTTRLDKPFAKGDIPLPGGQPRDREIWNKWNGETIVRNVTNPKLTPFLPKAGKATGAAVIVIPGGGFHFLSMANEGWPIARQLAERGITAFVLKYRVEPTPVDDAEFDALVIKRFAPTDWIGGTPPYLSGTATYARQDAQAALRMVRARAAGWGIDPHRVGVLGFSAGAITAINLTVDNADDARPDFVGALYGHMLPVAAPAQPPPLFLAVADDDVAFAKQGAGLIESWRKEKGSVELHWYEGGGHGFGSAKKGTTSDFWFDQYLSWLKAKKFVK
jgi:acetyl esterase/lipase